MKGECMRIGAVRLGLALMLALLVVPGYVVAPVLFAKAGSASLAGMLAGKIFHVANISILLLAFSVAFFWKRMQGRYTNRNRWRWLLLLVVAVLVAVNEFALSPIMADLKLQMGPIEDVARDDPQRQLFGMWHGLSAIIHLLATMMTVLLVAMGARPASAETVSGEPA